MHFVKRSDMKSRKVSFSKYNTGGFIAPSHTQCRKTDDRKISFHCRDELISWSIYNISEVYVSLNEASHLQCQYVRIILEVPDGNDMMWKPGTDTVRSLGPVEERLSLKILILINTPTSGYQSLSMASRWYTSASGSALGSENYTILSWRWPLQIGGIWLGPAALIYRSGIPWQTADEEPYDASTRSGEVGTFVNRSSG